MGLSAVSLLGSTAPPSLSTTSSSFSHDWEVLDGQDGNDRCSTLLSSAWVAACVAATCGTARRLCVPMPQEHTLRDVICCSVHALGRGSGNGASVVTVDGVMRRSAGEELGRRSAQRVEPAR